MKRFCGLENVERIRGVRKRVYRSSNRSLRLSVGIGDSGSRVSISFRTNIMVQQTPMLALGCGV